ncbi:MAG: MBL fold metallo-hydrolase [Treponema sp.]|nr:MBL fold metallo-hydrolase [Treponema sp.]
MIGKKTVAQPLVLSFAILSFTSCANTPAFDEAEWLKAIKAQDLSSLYAPHVNPDGTFFNPWNSTAEHFGSHFRSGRSFDSFPKEKYTHVSNDYSYLADRDFDSISYVGHASTIIKMDGETVFTDPFFSNRALVLSKSVKLKFDYSKIPLRPVVLVSHNHYDHLDKKSVRELIKKSAIFLVPLGLKDFVAKLGAEEVYEFDWWQNLEIGPLKYTFLPAQHSSGRIGQGANSTLWGGWLIQGSKTVYFSGDTGYFCGFEEFGKRFDIDYALLQAGAYEPRGFMYYSHMNIEEFFRASDDLNAKTTIPVHFGVLRETGTEPLLYTLYEIEQFIQQNPAYQQRIHSLRVGEYLGVK